MSDSNNNQHQHNHNRLFTQQLMEKQYVGGYVNNLSKDINNKRLLYNQENLITGNVSHPIMYNQQLPNTVINRLR